MMFVPRCRSTAPHSGLDAWDEIAGAGVRFVRNYTVWKAVGADEQMIAVAEELDAAPAHGLQLWLALAGVDNDLSHQALLDNIVNAVKGHPGLGLWKRDARHLERRGRCTPQGSSVACSRPPS